MGLRQKRIAISTRTVLVALVVAVLLPVMLFSGILLHRYAASEARGTATTSLDMAQRTSLAVDRQISGILTAIEVLATSNSLTRGDIDSFLREAGAARKVVGGNIVLRLPDGKQIANLRAPPDTNAPQTVSPALRKEVVDDRGRYVSGLLLRPDGEKVVVLTVPVVRNDAVTYMLSLAITSNELSRAVTDASIPAGWIVTLIDRDDVIIARNRENERFVGQKLTAEIGSHIKSNFGTWEGHTMDGQPVIAGFNRSGLTGWRVAVGGPKGALEQAFGRSFTALTLFGFFMLTLSLAAAFWLSTYIAQPLRSLAVYGAAMRPGPPEVALDTPIREIGQLRDAMAEAFTAAGEREKERNAALLALQNLNQVLEKRIRERTAELEALNASLIAEMRQRESAEAKLQQLQKMEVVGQLTGGIAHDFNNMLAVITASLNLLQRRLVRGDGDVLPLADAAIEGANRAAALTQRLLAFSRQQPLSPKVLDPNKMVREMGDLLRRTLGEDIRLETVLTDGLWLVDADESQLENAILNLAVNSRDAMPAGGRLLIETENLHVDANHEWLPEGAYASITVTDTGSGMSDEIMGRALEPFFTTKGIGKGTGLGLSQIYGFVSQSGGYVRIFSALGQGTSVRLCLPRSTAAVTAKVEAARRPPRVGNERVLVVEDEAKVREATVGAVRELGYDVLEAAGAAHALRLLDANPDVALLFTDIVMPDMNGHALAAEALRRQPDIRVLFTTGYTPGVILSEAASTIDRPCLPKPFSLEELADKISEALDDTA